MCRWKWKYNERSREAKRLANEPNLPGTIVTKMGAMMKSVFFCTRWQLPHSARSERDKSSLAHISKPDRFNFSMQFGGFAPIVYTSLVSIDCGLVKTMTRDANRATYFLIRSGNTKPKKRQGTVFGLDSHITQTSQSNRKEAHLFVITEMQFSSTTFNELIFS